MMRILTRSLLALLLTAATVPAFAQSAQTGTISGAVTDGTGGALPGVTVTITSQQRGFSRSAATDENGRFVFPAVPIGVYTVSAELQGFETFVATNNVVETDKTTSVPFAMKLGQLTDKVTVVGETPIVDETTATVQTRLRSEEFQKLPIGRSYLNLIGAAPGVVGTGNVNSLGALTSNNLFIIDAVDTTDPTTGTFGTNLNFESVQEVSVYTAAAGAEYGRAPGAVVNVITKSGTNRFEGAFKYLMINDDWDKQNSVTSQTNGASLARVKFDHVNPVYSFTGGGPIWKNHAWFFGAYDHMPVTSPQRQTAGQIPEDFQSIRTDKYGNYRGTVRLSDGQTAWVKYLRSPGVGIVRDDYWGTNATGEREALTAQDQFSSSWAGQWSGVLKNNWSMEAAVSTYDSEILVTTYEAGVLNNAPIFNIADSKYYNGATFDGFVDRPRKQFNVASNWFLTLGRHGHNVKAGYDFQNIESGAQFDYPNRQLYIVDNYVQATHTIVPGPNTVRRDYDSGASVSKGKVHALFIRDKFELTNRLSMEAGVRYEKQTGTSDIGASTVKTNTLDPRLSATYDLTGDGKSLIVGSYGRYHAGIILAFSDAFAQIAQQTNYDNYVWNGSAFVFSNRVQLSGSSFAPNTSLDPYYVDEGTIGFQRQLGQSIGLGVRYVARYWGDIIDDIRTFNADNSINRQVVNYDDAEHTYKGIQFTGEKRLSNNWLAQGSYTYSHTRGNHFGDNFTALGDYLDASCRTTTDLTIGTNGVIPCAVVNNGSNKYGSPSFDRPHNLKLNGAYLRPMGPLNLTVGALTEAISKQRFEKVRTVNVLLPGTLTNQGATATYFYEARGDSPVDGLAWYLDTSVELGWKFQSVHEAAFKAEIFNLTNSEEQLLSNNTTWCGSTAGTGCQAAIDNFGKATSRNSFRQPRRYRFSFIVRF